MTDVCDLIGSIPKLTPVRKVMMPLGILFLIIGILIPKSNINLTASSSCNQKNINMEINFKMKKKKKKQRKSQAGKTLMKLGKRIAKY